MKGTIKLTSKRQATFPAEVCESLQVGPGDEIELIPRVEEGRKVWLLRPKTAPLRPWFGVLRRYAERVESHEMEDVRKSIAEGRKRP